MKEVKTIEDSPKPKMKQGSSPQGNSEFFLALTWPKQLSCDPNQGTSATQLHNSNDGNNPQPTVDRNRTPSLTLGNSNTDFSRKWFTTNTQRPQNAIGHHSQQKRGEDDTHAQSEMETEIILSQHPTVMEEQQHPNCGLHKQQARITG